MAWSFDALASFGIPTVTEVLLYHVVPGKKLGPIQVLFSRQLTMANGGTVGVKLLRVPVGRVLAERLVDDRADRDADRDHRGARTARPLRRQRGDDPVRRGGLPPEFDRIG